MSDDELIEKYRETEWELAVIAYVAYGASTDHKNYQGLPMPTWDDLTDAIKTAWKAAARAVASEYGD